jgi:hypothetical protein
LLLDWAHRIWAPIDWIARLSPFYYFNPYELVATGRLRLPWEARRKIGVKLTA